MSVRKSALVSWAQVFATIFLGFVGVCFTYVQNIQLEKTRVAQLGAQLMNQREQVEIDFRQRMFQPLVEELLDRRGSHRRPGDDFEDLST